MDRHILQIIKLKDDEKPEQGTIVTQCDVQEDRIKAVVAAAFDLAKPRGQKVETAKVAVQKPAR